MVVNISRIFILVSMLLALVSVNSAEAKSPIPGIKSTAEYKSLNNFINNQLVPNQGAELPQEQITDYGIDLSDKNISANNKADLLFNRRKSRTINEIDTNRKKAIKKVNKQKQQRLGKAESKLNKKLGKVNSKYRQGLNDLNQKYGKRIAALKKTIARLERQKAQTRNPRKLALIEDRLDQAEVLLQNLQEDEKDELQELKQDRKQGRSAANKAYRQQVNKINKSIQRQIKSVRSDYIQRQQRRMDTNRTLRTSEKSEIKNLYDNGRAMIDSMVPIPPVLPT